MNKYSLNRKKNIEIKSIYPRPGSHLIPKLHNNICLKSTPTGFCLVSPDGQNLLDGLDRTDITALLLCNGEWSCGEIEYEVALWGCNYPDGWVTGFARHLEQHGILKITPKTMAVRVWGNSGHSCEMSNCCCENVLVGPLKESYVSKLRGYHKELVQKIPELGEHKPVETVQTEYGAVYYLGHRGRSCLFLSDQGCLLHAHLGASAKPPNCRILPHRFIKTEQEIRVAPCSMCITHHKNYKKTAAPDLKNLYHDACVELAPKTRRFSIASEQKFRTQEGLCLKILKEKEPQELLYRLLTDVDLKFPENLWDQCLRNVYAKGLVKLPGSRPFREDTEQLLSVSNQFVQGLKRCIEAIPAYEKAVERQLIPTQSRSASDYVGDALSRFLFLREQVAFPELPGTVYWILAGADLAWYIASSDAGDKDPFDDFGYYFACWMGFFESSPSFPWTHGRTDFLISEFTNGLLGQ